MNVLFENWGASQVEIESAMPGDHLIMNPAMSATRSIDLEAEPSVVFGWLTQMGFGRAGWYSYDLIDNLGRRSATEIVPERQVQAEGDEVPGGPISFSVAVLEEPRLLALTVLDRRLLGHHIDFTLAYRLDQVTVEGQAVTRLVSRARAAINGPLGRPSSLALRLGDGVMVRRQLLGLRMRCG